MKTTQTGGSLPQDIMDIVSLFEKEQFDLFEKFATQKRKKPAYWSLFKKMYSLKEEGQARDTLNEPALKNWAEKKAKKTLSFNDLTKNLYKKLIEFLAQEHKKKEEDIWRLKLTKGLEEVEALMAYNLKSHAIAHFKKVEKLIPPYAERGSLIWNDSTVLTRAANLKQALSRFKKDDADLILNESENLLVELGSIGRNFYSPHSSGKENIDPKDLNALLRLEGDKMYVYRVLYVYGLMFGEYQSQLEGLNRILSQPKPHREIASIFTRKKGNYSQDQKGEALTLLNETFWLIMKFNLHLENRDHWGAIETLRAFNGIDNNAFNKATLAYVQMKFYEMGLAMNLKLKKVKKGVTLNEVLKDLFLFTEQEIQDLPTRIELNTIIFRFACGDFKECDNRIQKLLEKRSNKGIIDLRVLEALLFYELEGEDQKGFMKRFQDLIKKKTGYRFEKQFGKVFFDLGGWTGTKWRKIHLEQEKEEVEKLRELAHPTHPVHQLVIDWIDQTLNYDETR